MDRRAWRDMVHRVSQSRTQLKWLSMHAQGRGESGMTELFRRLAGSCLHCHVFNGFFCWGPSTLNCGVGKDSWESLGLQGDQPWVFFGRNDAKAETPVLWPPHAKSWLIGKHSDAGRDWGQEKKGMTEDEMTGWHHWLDGCESEWTPGVGDGQGGLACCNLWGHKESDMTKWLNWTEAYGWTYENEHEVWRPFFIRKPYSLKRHHTGWLEWLMSARLVDHSIFGTMGSSTEYPWWQGWETLHGPKAWAPPPQCWSTCHC